MTCRSNDFELGQVFYIDGCAVKTSALLGDRWGTCTICGETRVCYILCGTNEIRCATPCELSRAPYELRVWHVDTEEAENEE